MTPLAVTAFSLASPLGIGMSPPVEPDTTRSSAAIASPCAFDTSV